MGGVPQLAAVVCAATELAFSGGIIQAGRHGSQDLPVRSITPFAWVEVQLDPPSDWAGWGASPRKAFFLPSLVSWLSVSAFMPGVGRGIGGGRQGASRPPPAGMDAGYRPW